MKPRDKQPGASSGAQQGHRGSSCMCSLLSHLDQSPLGFPSSQLHSRGQRVEGKGAHTSGLCSLLQSTPEAPPPNFHFPFMG